MDHVAFLSESRHLLAKILSGEKTIESRWYHARIAPYNRIKSGEKVYFKESGHPVTAQATVSKVVQVDELSEPKVKDLLRQYGPEIGFPKESWNEWSQRLGKKNYAILIFLREVREVAPFEIDKTGFGNMVAWISIPDIRKIKRD